MYSSIKEIIRFLFAVMLVGPSIGFLCGIAVGIVDSVFTGLALPPGSLLFFGFAGAFAAVPCVGLSYFTLRRYDVRVAIIFCTSGTLIFAIMPMAISIEATPISWLTGILGYWIGLILLNFNIGVGRVERIIGLDSIDSQDKGDRHL